MVTQVEPCRHHWLIETPNGETSVGRCKLCGATRSFTNGGIKVTKASQALGRFPKKDDSIAK